MHGRKSMLSIRVLGNYVVILLKRRYIVEMGNFSVQQELKKETRERDKSRKENLGKFFYDLAKLTFAGVVIGSITPWFTEKEIVFNPYVFISGLVTTSIWAFVGYRTFK